MCWLGRLRRSISSHEKNAAAIRYKVQANVKLPAKWKDFLLVNEHKEELFHFLAQEIYGHRFAEHKQILVTSGSKVLSKNTPAMPKCTHEEADSRIFIHVIDALEENNNCSQYKQLKLTWLPFALKNFMMFWQDIQISNCGSSLARDHLSMLFMSKVFVRSLEGPLQGVCYFSMLSLVATQPLPSKARARRQHGKHGQVFKLLLLFLSFCLKIHFKLLPRNLLSFCSSKSLLSACTIRMWMHWESMRQDWSCLP